MGPLSAFQNKVGITSKLNNEPTIHFTHETYRMFCKKGTKNVNKKEYLDNPNPQELVSNAFSNLKEMSNVLFWCTYNNAMAEI